MDHPESPAPARWERLGSRRLLERWWMTLREDRVRLPSGHVLDEYHVAEYPDWACALALTDDGRAVLVEQYRYGIDRVCLELPAGALDTGETPLEAARRELREETGYEAARWTPLGRCAVEPGRHTNWGYLFVAEGARRVAAPSPDAAEDLAVRLVPASTLVALIDRERIVHGVHVAAVLWAARHGLLPAEAGVNRGRGRAFTPGPDPPLSPLRPMPQERTTVIVSVNTELDEEARFAHIERQVGAGWRVQSAIPLSGGDLGPGGESGSFLRMEVHLVRDVDEDGVIVQTRPDVDARDAFYDDASDVDAPDAGSAG